MNKRVKEWKRKGTEETQKRTNGTEIKHIINNGFWLAICDILCVIAKSAYFFYQWICSLVGVNFCLHALTFFFLCVSSLERRAVKVSKAWNWIGFNNNNSKWRFPMHGTHGVWAYSLHLLYRWVQSTAYDPIFFVTSHWNHTHTVDMQTESFSS